MSVQANADDTAAIEPCSVVAEPSGEGEVVLRLAGAWTLQNRIPSLEEVRGSIEATPGSKKISFESTGLSAWDSGFLTFLLRLSAHCEQVDMAVDLSGLPEGEEVLLPLGGDTLIRARTTGDEKALVGIGSGVLLEHGFGEAVEMLEIRIKEMDTVRKKMLHNLQQLQLLVEQEQQKLQQYLHQANHLGV